MAKTVTSMLIGIAIAPALADTEDGRRAPSCSGARAATERADRPHLRPGVATPFFGYGYQTWIFPGERRMFALLGVRGQATASSRRILGCGGQRSVAGCAAHSGKYRCRLAKTAVDPLSGRPRRPSVRR
jgi:hypothetical protein